jgi:hypothetical protein
MLNIIDERSEESESICSAHCSVVFHIVL